MKRKNPFQSKDDYKLKDIKNLPFEKKIQHIVSYYKVPIFLTLLVVYLLSYGAYRHATEETKVLYTGFVNITVGDDLQKLLTEDFISQAGLSGKRNDVEAYKELYLAENPTSEEQSYVYASQLKILAAIDNETLDFVFMTQEVFDSFAQNGYLMDLEAFLKDNNPELYQKTKPMLVENLEILWDNSDEVMADRSIEYESETTTYLMGIDLSDISCIKTAGFPEKVYLGVLKNTPRSELVLDYLNYLIAN